MPYLPVLSREFLRKVSAFARGSLASSSPSSTAGTGVLAKGCYQQLSAGICDT